MLIFTMIAQEINNSTKNNLLKWRNKHIWFSIKRLIRIQCTCKSFMWILKIN